MGITMSTMLRFYNKYKYSLPVRRYLTERQTIIKFFKKYYFGFLSKEEEAIPKEVWDYEGTMTVGEDGEFKTGFNMYGGVVEFGTLVPEYLPTQCSLFFTTEEMSILIHGNIDILKIDDIEITGFTFSNISSLSMYNLLSNPFPAVGETCSIKIKLAV